jgi:5'-3' exonuclease
MTIHDLINKDGVSVDTTSQSCITALIDADSIIYIIGWNHRDIDNPDTVAAAVDRFINDILVKTQARQYAGFFSDKKCFRNEIYLDYKANRKDINPGIEKWKPYIIEYCIEMWKFEKLSKLEADDAVAELQRSMVNSVICSPDKDLKQIPGNNYNYQKDVHCHIEKDEALYNWATQMICGDTSDNIKGIPKSGPVAASKLLDPLRGSSPEVYVQAVEDAYYNKFGNLDEYHLHCKLIGVGMENLNAALPYINTFDLESAVPSEYIRPNQENVGQDAEDLFGSW